MTEKFNLKQAIKQVSGFEFGDPDKDREYQQLLIKLNSIVSNMSVEEFFDSVNDMAQFQALLDRIVELVSGESDAENLASILAWAESQLQLDDVAAWVDETFEFEHGDIIVRDGVLSLSRQALLTVIPSGLKNLEILSLFMCPAIDSLPAGMMELKKLAIENCRSLVSFPEPFNRQVKVFIGGEADPSLQRQIKQYEADKKIAKVIEI
ncbi:hypothetical protein COT97_00885 [Candidatus Falkowbacteria bacterium CG10_big_fil_rev_8_21_14_0_10_39_11]|uniref:Leucine-rich repeat domain-containing protein n=1 Tax=Candidatus Falkowbacteria bacterium CG10_big_fil_rev_8_21_14_0_10_39_11 TaxID=1974565 RepID=A0A2H0V5V6_9BACT|nr:MAG: hypothetical protein COT97_00885 [Candidatus Falkowbacteria bacterium CG10_big_fil_rev_8_21_14_0_10_39_11]